MSNIVKDLANKGYTYLPYLWNIRLKIKGMYLSLDYWLKNAKAWKIGIISHCQKIKYIGGDYEYHGYGDR